jgi:hypothetical protein
LLLLKVLAQKAPASSSTEAMRHENSKLKGSFFEGVCNSFYLSKETVQAWQDGMHFFHVPAGDIFKLLCA